MQNQLTGLTYALVSMIILINIFGVAGASSEKEGSNSTIPLLDRQEHETVRTATFALGCFWGGDAMYGAVPGVIRTRVGYAGGTMENPTYRNLGDHTESIQVDYDPEVVSFEELVELFWESHNPNSRGYSTQYANILFYHDDNQENIAERTKRELSSESEKEVYTRIKEIGEFYPAETYHQKYRLRQSSPYIGIMKDIYPDPEDIRDSTAAARLNGFLAGHGTPEQVNKLIGKLGLTRAARDKLLKSFGMKGENISCG